MTVEAHIRKNMQPVRCSVITVSDTRDETTDRSGKLMMELLEEQGQSLSSYRIVKDEEELIQEAIMAEVQRDDVDVVLLNGGTGIAKRDVTIEVVESMADKIISGFGELFRMLSYTEDIGTAAMLSRATGAVVRSTGVFATPGSSGAVKLAMERLILPELVHIRNELKK
ncbi:molybdenum cofactor biosynthesis protein B [Pontibacillus halophilus JSM 076056 = DSM 19796]|uniref:Molybdenum cofactor biosynthesis protein B n=1 Tax=Pontibacillus halophilus JSM 076056 = DSM 19796 TaxID=1385510 RepID=A0A0A5GMY0_9BACI|nr:MogA/MoaB family molybdenum cofactor biosynthesis protein [Pontibacillus halophilus]KGX93354.1 molybdenum cofactor biosynthesis protein B [Pontibacillus halophilus JSM 076056 = DSM 19796]